MVSMEQGRFTVEGQQELQVPAYVAYQVLTHYEAGAQVFSNIKSCRVERLSSGATTLHQVGA